MNVWAAGTAAAGLGLLCVNLAGLLRTRRPARRGNPRGQDLVHSARTIGQLLACLPPGCQADPPRFCRELTRALAARFEHGSGRHDVWSNYLCWLAGRFVPRLAEIHLTSALLWTSDRALCSQIAQAFVDACQRAGLIARLVGLDGHVVAELQYAGGWHGADPDYGIVFGLPGREIVSVAALAETPDLAAQVYASHRLPRGSEEVLAILDRRQPTYLPAGASGVPRLARLQRWAEWGKWLLPATLLSLACGLNWLT
ncbi:MAG: hypothetical protein J5I93_23165 [Pirellulaceae bacterium]|nr:hypothetical protein [Pirellulaceae bacterium]